MNVFGKALKNFLSNVNVAFAKVYSHKEYSEEVFDYLRKIPNLKIKSVNNGGPNAADENLIQSCGCVIRDKPEITHVVLLSGDDDYRAIINDLITQGKWVGLISYENYSQKLQKKVHFHITIDEIIQRPKKWWTSINSNNIGSQNKSKVTKQKKLSGPKKISQRVSILHSSPKPNFIPILPPRKKIQILFTRDQWNKIFHVMNKIYKNEFLKNAKNQFNPVELTYEIHQLMKTGEIMTLTNSQILLLLKKLSEIGFLIEHVTDSWMLAENLEQSQNDYDKKIMSSSENQ